MSEHHDPSPVNPLPTVVVILALLLVGIEGIFLLAENGLLGGGTGFAWRAQAVEDFGFYAQIPAFLLTYGTEQPELLLRFVTYCFIHASFSHFLFAGVFLLALGKFVGEIFNPFAVVAVFLTSAIGGALLYGLLWREAPPLIGAFPAVYGLIGAYSFVLWRLAEHVGESQLGAFRLIAMLMGIQLVFAVIFGGGWDWVADLGGFVTGFGLSFFVSPGGASRVQSIFRR